MATEKFTNRAYTTLNGSINNLTTSVVVTSASAFPSTGQFRIVIDTEIMLVTAVSSNTFTVTRGAESTTAASHADLASVYHVLTAGSLDQYRSDNIRSDTYANLPAAEKAGRLYLPTDSPYTLFDNGTSWIPTVNGIQCTIPDFSGFTWVNQGSATTSTSQGYTFLSDLTTTAASELRILKKAAINTTSYTVTAGIIPLVNRSQLSNNTQAGLGLIQRNSSSGKIIIYGLVVKTLGFAPQDSQPYLALSIWDYTNASTATLFPFFRWQPFPSGNVWWMRLKDDGTNRKYQMSLDGANYSTIYSEARTSFITPDEYGIYCDGDGQTACLVGGSYIHFSETTP